MRTFLAVAGAAILLIAASLLLLRPTGDQSAAPVEGLPWQIEALPGGDVRVFGLTLAGSTLGDARVRFGEDMELGIVAARGEPGALEAYYQDVTAGTIVGKMVLVGALDPATLGRMREHAVKREYMHATTYRYILDPDDLATAWRARIATITFIPAVSISTETAVARFGAPQERLRSSEQVEHLLYPDKGLDLAIDARGKAVMQYVAPREFARLRAPLENSAASKPERH